MKASSVFRVLALGDVVGESGKVAVRNALNLLSSRYQPDLVVVNGENAAHGFGITEKNVQQLFSYGVDVITTGNHVWQKKEIFNFVDKYPEFLRPLNYPPQTPGHGSVVIERNGVRVAVINAMGRTYMDALDCPFRTTEKEIERLQKQGIKHILVDFHAEATSEKQMLGRFLDGKVSGVWGTHTHVQTADEQIFPGKTAYITDLGMSGCIESVIGMKIKDSYRRVINHLPVRFSPADEGPMEVRGVLIDLDRESGQAVMISRIREDAGYFEPKQKGTNGKNG